MIWILNYFLNLKEWIPTIKSGWFAFVTSIEPSFELLTAKVVDVYHASKKTIGPHIVKAQQTLDPYFKVFNESIMSSLRSSGRIYPDVNFSGS